MIVRTNRKGRWQQRCAVVGEEYGCVSIRFRRTFHSLIPFSHDSFISFVISIDFDSLLYCGVSYCTLKYYVYDNFLFYQPVTFFFFFLRLRCSVCTTTCSVFHFDFFSFSTCVWCCIPPLALCVLFLPLYFYFKIGLFLLFKGFLRPS
jgi:hypothetical protein